MDLLRHGIKELSQKSKYKELKWPGTAKVIPASQPGKLIVSEFKKYSEILKFISVYYCSNGHRPKAILRNKCKIFVQYNVFFNKFLLLFAVETVGFHAIYIYFNLSLL